jgi:hypothetical protein
MPKERTQITELGRRHPDRREAILRQQLEEQRCVSAVVLLSAGFDFSDFCGVTDGPGHAELLHQPEKPSHRPGGFNARDDPRRQASVEVPHRRPVGFQRSPDDLPCLAIQHRDRLLRFVQIAANNLHLGLLRLERCEGGGHRTVYAGRREADVVMTSFWRRF